MSLSVLQVAKLPLRYDAQGQSIHDADGNRLLDIRGWGWIQSRLDAPEDAQDAFGRQVCDLLNRQAESEQAPVYDHPQQKSRQVQRAEERAERKQASP